MCVRFAHWLPHCTTPGASRCSGNRCPQDRAQIEFTGSYIGRSPAWGLYVIVSLPAYFSGSSLPGCVSPAPAPAGPLQGGTGRCLLERKRVPAASAQEGSRGSVPVVCPLSEQLSAQHAVSAQWISGCCVFSQDRKLSGWDCGRGSRPARWEHNGRPV